ncbi:hypothetical protein D3C78_1453610 [compost metagenome]
MAQPPQRALRVRQAAAVELVVARHVDHGLAQAQRPGCGFLGAGYVAGQDDDIGVGAWRFHGLVAQVQVRQDVELHGGDLSFHLAFPAPPAYSDFRYSARSMICCASRPKASLSL